MPRVKSLNTKNLKQNKTKPVTQKVNETFTECRTKQENKITGNF